MKTMNRVMGKPFQPGRSGNPGGRPINKFAAYIRKNTNQGEELAKGVLEMFREANDPDIKIKAATWLRDSGFGKPQQSIDLEGSFQGPPIIKIVNYADLKLPGEENAIPNKLGLSTNNI